MANTSAIGERYRNLAQVNGTRAAASYLRDRVPSPSALLPETVELTREQRVEGAIDLCRSAGKPFTIRQFLALAKVSSSWFYRDRQAPLVAKVKALYSELEAASNAVDSSEAKLAKQQAWGELAEKRKAAVTQAFNTLVEQKQPFTVEDLLTAAAVPPQWFYHQDYESWRQPFLKAALESHGGAEETKPGRRTIRQRFEEAILVFETGKQHYYSVFEFSRTAKVSLAWLHKPEQRPLLEKLKALVEQSIQGVPSGKRKFPIVVKETKTRAKNKKIFQQRDSAARLALKELVEAGQPFKLHDVMVLAKLPKQWLYCKNIYETEGRNALRDEINAAIANQQKQQVAEVAQTARKVETEELGAIATPAQGFVAAWIDREICDVKERMSLGQQRFEKLLSEAGAIAQELSRQAADLKALEIVKDLRKNHESTTATALDSQSCKV